MSQLKASHTSPIVRAKPSSLRSEPQNPRGERPSGNCCGLLAILTAAYITSLVAIPIYSNAGGSRPQESLLAPQLGQDGDLIGRTKLKCPEGDCLVERYLTAVTQIDHDRIEMSRQNDFAELIFEVDNPWFIGQDAGTCLSTFNCCAFAVGDCVGLTPSDWVGCDPLPDGGPTPIAVLIDSYFDLVCEFPLNDPQTDHLYQKDSRIHVGDVVCFEMAAETTDPLRRTFTHAGQVRKKDGTNRLLSKFGAGPILLSDLSYPNRMFPGAHTVKVYRTRN